MSVQFAGYRFALDKYENDVPDGVVCTKATSVSLKKQGVKDVVALDIDTWYDVGKERFMLIGTNYCSGSCMLLTSDGVLYTGNFRYSAVWWAKSAHAAVRQAKPKHIVVPFTPLEESGISMADAMNRLNRGGTVVDPDHRLDALWCPIGATMDAAVKKSKYSTGECKKGKYAPKIVAKKPRGAVIDFSDYTLLCSKKELGAFLKAVEKS